MSEFRSECHVKVAPASGKFILTQPLVYYSDILQREIIAPVGFSTDFASIPRLLQWLIQVNGKHRPAAVIHDLLCDESIQRILGINQRKADKVLLEAMETLEVRCTQSIAMFLAVRLYQSVAGIFR